MNKQSNNIEYSSNQLLKKYSTERNRWGEFYESERHIFERYFTGRTGVSVLDVGCACGGLLSAFEEKGFPVQSYRGVDINNQMIEYAKGRQDLRTPHEFSCADVSKLDNGEEFDLVVSLSCIDWNNDVLGMLQKCWSKVKGGATLIMSVRLTDRKSILSGAWQYLDSADGERYNYVAFNFRDLRDTLMELLPRPSNIECYGYWGKPSATAVIEYDRLCFSVFAITKGMDEQNAETRLLCDLPLDAI